MFTDEKPFQYIAIISKLRKPAFHGINKNVQRKRNGLAKLPNRSTVSIEVFVEPNCLFVALLHIHTSFNNKMRQGWKHLKMFSPQWTCSFEVQLSLHSLLCYDLLENSNCVNFLLVKLQIINKQWLTTQSYST